MLWVYVVALLAGGGVLALQLVLAHDSGDGDGGHDTAHGDAALWPMVTSLRFWTFALFGCGLFGTIASLLGAAPLLVGLFAVGSGGGAGLLATWTVRRLSSRVAVAHAAVADAVGKLGRVVVALDDGRPGKIRVDMGGDLHDLVARAPVAIGVGEQVIVESVDDGIATVSRAPAELRLLGK